jgi:hypothetical protein
MASLASRRPTERGEGNLGNLVKLAIFAALALAAFNVGPVYFANYRFQDRVTEIAGQFPPNKSGDDRALKAVEQAITEADLSEFLSIDACSVSSSGGIGGSRTVTCSYDREYKLLPGMTPKVAHFEINVSRPMF